jgi:nitroreductase
METWDAIRARRNVRSYEDRTIPDDDLDRILEAARRTPSSMNQQAWDFVVVTDGVARGTVSASYEDLKIVVSECAFEEAFSCWRTRQGNPGIPKVRTVTVFDINSFSVIA